MGFTMVYHGLPHCTLQWFRLCPQADEKGLALKLWGNLLGGEEENHREILFIPKINGCSNPFFVNKRKQNRENIWENFVFVHLDPANLPGILRRWEQSFRIRNWPILGQSFAVMANLISWSRTCDVRILPKHWPFFKGRCWNSSYYEGNQKYQNVALNFHLLLCPLWVDQPQTIPNSNFQRQFPQTATGYRRVLHLPTVDQPRPPQSNPV